MTYEQSTAAFHNPVTDSNDGVHDQGSACRSGSALTSNYLRLSW